MRELNERQLLAVDLLAAGTREKDTAAQLGINRTTLSVWKADASFRYALESRRFDMRETIASRLMAVADRALQTLLDVMQDDTQPAAARVSAAKCVLDRVLRAGPPTAEPIQPETKGVSDAEIMRMCLDAHTKAKPTPPTPPSIAH